MVKVYAYTVKERRDKTRYLMNELARNSGGQIQVVDDETFRDDGVLVVWGQIYYSKTLMIKATRSGVPFIQIDNGYFNAARGMRQGYLRFTLNGLVQNKILDFPMDRLSSLDIDWQPMRQREDARVLVVCVPGPNFGRYLDFDMCKWGYDVAQRLRYLTDKKVIVREKTDKPSFNEFLKATKPFGIVTHGSNVGVDAIVKGYPVFCDPMCAASPVANTDIYDINNPVLPTHEERLRWAASLAYHQYSYEEIGNGVAWGHLRELYRDVLC